MTYNADFSELRAIKDGQRRYVKMRAVANGPDSYNSIFTDKARKSIVDQIKQGSVKSKVLHKDTVYENIQRFLNSQLSKVSSSDRSIVETLLGQLPMAEFPVAKVIDAEFENDNSLVVTAEFNEELSRVSPEESMKLDAYWEMLNNGAINGASLVFGNVRSFNADGKLFIDDLRVTGIDFVDRQSHQDTQILQTFVRAASEAIIQTPSQSESNGFHNGTKMAETEFKKVDEVLEKATKIVNKIEADELAKATAQAQEVEKARLSELDNLKQQILQREKEADELAQIAQEAVAKLKDAKAKSAVTYSNPIAEAHFSNGNSQQKTVTKNDLREALKAKFK
jgi:hypothetical protein